MAAVAARYARALADVVARPGAPAAPEALVAELRGFLELLKTSEELRTVLANPAVAAARKRALVQRLGELVQLSRVGRNFLFVLLDHRRINQLEEILRLLENMLDERRGIVRAQVTSAAGLGEAERRLLEAALRGLTGKQVRMEFSVEPELLGGAVTRIGSTIYDGSVREQLRQIRQRLSAE